MEKGQASAEVEAAEEAAQLIGSIGDNVDGIFGFFGEADEVRHNGPIREGLTLAEAYYAGKFEVCFPFGSCGEAGSPSCATIPEASGHIKVESISLVQDKRDAFIGVSRVLRHELGQIGDRSYCQKLCMGLSCGGAILAFSIHEFDASNDLGELI